MAPHLTKKQQQQQQQQQQQPQHQHQLNHHQPSDIVRQPNIWRFIPVRRFGQRAPRESADEDDNVQHAGLKHRGYDESDGSNSIFLVDESGSDLESVYSESQYSDAHSHWEHPLTNREDAISFAFSELLQGDDTQDSPPSKSLPSAARHGTPNAVHRPDSSWTINGSTDAVVNFQGLENQFDAYFARESPPPSHNMRHMAIDPFSAESLTPQQRPQGHFWKDVSGSSGKGKGTLKSSDWSTLANPWALLNAGISESDERDAILKENARLRAEIEELKVATSRDHPQDLSRHGMESPIRSPSTRPSSRLRRQKNKKRQDVTLFETTTLRDLVLKRLFTPHVIADGIIHNEEQPLTLDTPLTAAQVHDITKIMNDIIVSGSHLKQPIALCAVCHLPKFKGIKTMQQNSYVSQVLAQLPMVSASAFEDFDPVWGTSTCCRRYVCKTCLSAAIISGISTHWWFDLPNDGSNWLKCPVPCCGRNLPLSSSNEIDEILQKLGVHNIRPHLDRYERASRLRSQLQDLSPLPTKDELRRSKALHDRLIRHRRMSPLLEESPDREIQENLEAVLQSVDTSDGRGTMKIPIFKGLFKHQVTKACLVCDETYNELNFGNTETWNKIIQGFGGEWPWRILAFPTAEVLSGCQHDHAICRGCLAKYVTTQVECQGHSVVENISCPTPGCRHKFSHEEIRKLATPETFSLYDHYTVLRSISSQPNFRWCLREGCVSGSLYDDPASSSSAETAIEVDRNFIECSECSFTMCYTCQAPWHPHLTCAQYSSQRESSFEETQTWLAQHTKPCPGEDCGVQVQKGDGCFHMTCSRCHYEFCWECLADWRGIFVPGEDGGFLRSDGHREGCFFRGEGAPLPTQINGHDIETGLRNLEQREDAGADAGAGADVVIADADIAHVVVGE